MIITKVINNNVVSSHDEKGIEVIVMGKGVGFQKKAKDKIEKSKIEKVFHLSNELQDKLAELVSNIPYEYLVLTDEVVAEAGSVLGKKLSKNIYLTLADHLSFAIERQKKGIVFENALLWEIKRYYKEEFNAGLKAVEVVRKKTGINLPEDEAASVAIHLLNAEVTSDIKKTMSMPEIIKEILNIVRYTMLIDFKEDSISYERFLTHLKFFVQRAISRKYYDTDEQFVLFEEITLCH